MAKAKLDPEALRKRLWAALERAHDTAVVPVADWGSVEVDLKDALAIVREIKKQERGLYEA